MSWNKYLGVVASGALVGVVTLANGCSSSGAKAGAGDGGNDSGTIHHPDTGTSSGDDSGGDDSGGTQTDGTTGKQCTTDADCNTGPGVDKCSNTGGTGFFMAGQLFSTPVCLIPPTQAGNCDPGTDGNLHFCDGPDDPSSPGVCLQDGSATVGICLPQCGFAQDGSAATGCVGTDVCNVAGFATSGADGGGPVVGIGYCFGGCITDADCPAGNKCQTDEGICLIAPTTGDAPQGTGCKASSTGASTPVCNCIANTSTNEGYCGQFCKTGGTACPTGSICDAQLPLTLVNSDDASIPGWTTANPGLAGFCSPTCVIDGGASDEAGTCYTNSTCQSGTVGGPNCLP